MRTIYTLKVTGLNLDNLLNVLYSKKIKISNIYRKKENTKEMFMDMSRADYISVMSDRVFDKFDVCVVRKRGLENGLFRLFSLSGAVLGIAISLILGFTINSRIWSIDIVVQGEASSGLKDDILSVLSDNNVAVGYPLAGQSMYDLSLAIVSSSEEISAATVEREGTRLLVKVYLASSIYKTGDLLATKNGVVKSVLIGTGTASVKVGDIVREGDTLLKADSSGNAVGTVMATVYYMGTVIYNENTQILEPTGNTKSLSIVEAMGIKVGKVTVPNFEYYELKVINKSPFENFFLPINIVTYEYMEMKKIEKHIPFEDVEDGIKEQAKMHAQQNMNSACQIVNIDYTIRREGSIVKVDCFIESLENIAG